MAVSGREFPDVDNGLHDHLGICEEHRQIFRQQLPDGLHIREARVRRLGIEGGIVGIDVDHERVRRERVLTVALPRQLAESHRTAHIAAKLGCPLACERRAVGGDGKARRGQRARDGGDDVFEIDGVAGIDQAVHAGVAAIHVFDGEVPLLGFG